MIGIKENPWEVDTKETVNLIKKMFKEQKKKRQRQARVANRRK